MPPSVRSAVTETGPAYVTAASRIKTVTAQSLSVWLQQQQAGSGGWPQHAVRYSLESHLSERHQPNSARAHAAQ